MIGNKTLCDICSSKAIRKARSKKEKDAPSTEPTSDYIDEMAANTAPSSAPTPATQHHHSAHDEGISQKSG